jgi:hypothetical protein
LKSLDIFTWRFVPLVDSLKKVGGLLGILCELLPGIDWARVSKGNLFC